MLGNIQSISEHAKLVFDCVLRNAFCEPLVLVEHNCIACNLIEGHPLKGFFEVSFHAETFSYVEAALLIFECSVDH